MSEETGIYSIELKVRKIRPFNPVAGYSEIYIIMSYKV